ncbi:MAG TPA: hypothetical protein PLP64_03005 [Pseudothermotoga sp.]|nr:hypothetical protein [Pseudothermotoga sp.]HOK83175.1 hypothetical protein [Pseudothermotoga sp.]HPP69654.1 hypothetical protein [Pseudothermotoga sp.]
MALRKVNQIIAFLFIFTLIFVLDVLSFHRVSSVLYSFFHPMTVLPFKSRVLALHILEGIKISLNQNNVETNNQQMQSSSEGFPVLGLREQYIVMAGESKPGDIAVDPDNKSLVGVVRSSDRQVSWIESVFSPNVIVQVTVESSTLKIDGELFFGNRLRIYENADVIGFEVKISDVFTCGTLLRNMGFEKLGKVVDRDGPYYVVDNNFNVPSRLVIFPGY